MSRYTDAGHEIHQRPAGSVMTIEFELKGQAFTALMAVPCFNSTKLSHSRYFATLKTKLTSTVISFSAGGDPNARQCGWLKDKFGRSWQIVPTNLIRLMQDEDAEKSGRVMRAMSQMKKLDIHRLRQEYEHT